MNKTETEQLLREMFAIDGRKVDADKILAWHNVIGSMPLEIAQRALRMARQDERITYVEPKHIFAKAKEAAEAMDREDERRKTLPPSDKGTPMPTCIHGMGLIACDPCCDTMYRFHESNHGHLQNCGELCHTYAKENVIA